jgi:predicted GIY-YIG superfamily endonuclease
MSGFHYVYILRSISQPNQAYTGQTANLRNRLTEHNAGKVPHTSKFVPWEIRTAVAFRDRERAIAFERYLKSGSGRAFAARHL